MASFTVRYRGRDGELRVVELEARDRADVFRQLAERGLSAIRVEESAGGKRRDARFKRAVRDSKKVSLRFGIGVCLSVAIVACLVVAWIIYVHQDTDVESPRIKDGKRGSKVVNVTTNSPARSEVPSYKDVEGAELVKKPQIPPANVITARSSRVGRVMTLMDGTVVTNKPEVIFERDFERGLMVALRPGGMTGGLFRLIRSRYSDEEILSMLKEMTIPNEDDDDVVRQTKANVQALKERALIAISEGSTVSQVLDEIQRQGTLDNLMKADAMKARAEAIRSGDPQLVRESVEEINKILEKNGVRKLDVPAQFAESPTTDEAQDTLTPSEEDE